MIDTFGTGVLDDEAIERAVLSVFDFRPAAIIEALDLRQPIYRQTAAYGHFGRPDLNLPWEKLDRLEALRQARVIKRISKTEAEKNPPPFMLAGGILSKTAEKCGVTCKPARAG
jgi:hypothetical protein